MYREYLMLGGRACMYIPKESGAKGDPVSEKCLLFFCGLASGRCQDPRAGGTRLSKPYLKRLASTAAAWHLGGILTTGHTPNT